MCVEEKTEVPIFISRWTIDLAREGMKDVAGILGQEAGAVTDAHGTPHGALSGVRHGGAGGLRRLLNDEDKEQETRGRRATRRGRVKDEYNVERRAGDRTRKKTAGV